ncbi:Hypothetical protein ABZS17D1_03869 [Kosakonia cowanii]
MMSADRLEGVMRLTPALGQQKLYDPVKPMPKAWATRFLRFPTPLPAISILVGPLFGSSAPSAVTVGNTAAPAYNTQPASAPVAAPAPAPAAKSEPMLNDTESYFNRAIKQAAEKGDIDKALKLLNEAERLGSKTARATFISSVKGKG